MEKRFEVTENVQKFNFVGDWTKLQSKSQAIYSLVRSEYPSYNKRGGVCVYYKNFLPLQGLDIKYLHECISFELEISNKLCSFVALHRSSSQAQDDFEKLYDDYELNLRTLS